jgi:lysophospholipase L1-like esterase
MTSLIEHEKQPLSGDPQLSGSRAVDTRRAQSRAGSRILTFLSRCVLGLGYTIVAAVVIASVLEFASWLICSIVPLTREAQFESQKASPVYEGAQWAREFWKEEALRREKTRSYVPFRLWGVTEWHSKYVNNDMGAEGALRRTINPDNCDPSTSTAVWTFGGSTMYGVGVPDWATLPSYLSRELNSGERTCVMVFNYGVEGYVTDQELIFLEEQLKAGRHPDVMIFYDGLNESMAQCPPGPPTPHGGYATIKSRVEGTVSGRLDFLQKSNALRLAGELKARLHPPHSLANQASDLRPRTMSVMSKYEANMRMARALADAYKFKLYAFWQPFLLYGHKPMVAFEQQLATANASKIPGDNACLSMMAATYNEAERRAAHDGGFMFLGSVFDTTKDPTYIDQGHLGPRGNEVVAQAIANYVHDHPEGSKMGDVKR